MVTYGFVKEIESDFEEAEDKVKAELQKEGFGVLTKIDMAAKFKEKLGENTRKYVILGACNPPHAFKAVSNEDNIGLLLPCNVIIRESEEGKTILGIIKPTVAMSMVNNEDIEPVAIAVEEALERVFRAIS